MCSAKCHAAEVSQLRDAIDAHVASLGVDLCERAIEASALLLDWISYLRSSEITGTADTLLNGVQAAIIEVVGDLAIGFVRPALFSLRAEIDMLLSWLFFKDHPIEWQFVNETGEGFRMKRDVLGYLEQFYGGFRLRYNLLEKNKQRKETEPYRLLSAHVHSQNTFVAPVVGPLGQLVSNKQKCMDCIMIQSEVTEYLNDVLLSCFSEKWASLPNSVMTSIRGRLRAKDLKVLFTQ